MSLNPANWAITNFIQGDEGAMGIKDLGKQAARGLPLIGGGDAIKDLYESGINSLGSTYQPENSITAVQSAQDTNQQNESQVDPNALGGGAGGSGSAGSAEDVNYLNDQQGLYERLLQSIRGGLTSGMQSLDQSEVQAKNEATGKQERKLRDLGTQRTDMMTEKDSALDRVDTGARQLYDNLRKLLGTASGTGSSAYQFAAPNAVARDASTKRSNVMTSFGRNERDLTTATEDTNVDFQDLLASIAQQRKQREQDLKAGVYGKEQEVQQTLAEIASQRAQAQGGGYGEQRVARQPFMDRYMSLQNDMDALPSQYSSPMAVRDLNVKTPELADFTVDKTAINANREMGASDASPYAQLLRKMRETEA